MKTAFRYYYDNIVFVRKSILYRTLSEAVLDHNREWIKPVPSAHNSRGPLASYSCGMNWHVVKTIDFARPGEKPSDWYIAKFADPLDAFAFAELRSKGKDKWVYYRVEFHWTTEDGRLEILEKLPVTWLRDIRLQRDRAEKLAHGRAA